jgi:hypothetical protein
MSKQPNSTNQAAKTMVVRLASDMAIICSTVVTANFDTEISSMAREVANLAYEAAANAKTASAPNIREVESVATAIGRLYYVIIRQKAFNPFVSDDLVSRIAEAEKDAREALSLTLSASK